MTAAELREASAVEDAARRVVRAFSALGESRSVTGTMTTLRHECEASMTALDTALKAADAARAHPQESE